MMIKKFVLILLMFGSICQGLEAQHEVETVLPYSTEQMMRIQKEREFPKTQPRENRDLLSLPFFDDFSRYSLPTNDPSIPDEWQRWSDQSAYINSTYPISPLTIGVATLDGLRSDGRPYKDTVYFPAINDVNLPWGACDSLTSLGIDLSGLTAEDNVYLMFHYQPGGRGNKPEMDALFSQGDSLTLEFYTPLNNGEWFRVWQTPSSDAVDQFTRVLIHIQDPIYLQEGFKFRFVNWGTKMGALDHWHLDYIYLAEDFDPATFDYEEVAQQYPLNTLLNHNYTAVPWTHFLSNPTYFMKNEFSYYQRNLGPTKNIVTRWKVSHNGTVIKVGQNLVDGQSNDHRELVKTVSTENFVYNSTETESADFDVCVYHDPTDANVSNDTTCFVQHFSNYYAYDDGTAERAYGLTSAGGKVAVRFTAEVPDTLYGVYMYYLPFMYLATNQSFFLHVWGQGNGVPGDLIAENFTFLAPQYYWDGPNGFVYYPLDEPIAVSGQFYVGWVQQNDVSLNIGLDKNTNANATRLFYQLGGTTTWNTSAIEGSVMIRPVFRAGMPDWVSVDEPNKPNLLIYPNPAKDAITLQLPADVNRYQITITDVYGRTISQELGVSSGTRQIDISSWAKGVYLLRVEGEVARETSWIHRLIKE